MKVIELLALVQAGESIACSVCQDTIASKDILDFNFKLGKLAPGMEKVVANPIVCVQCQRQDELIKVEPRGPDIKFVRG